MAGRRGVFPLLMHSGRLHGVELMCVRNRGWRGGRFNGRGRRIVSLLLLNVVDQGVEIGGSEGTKGLNNRVISIYSRCS